MVKLLVALLVFVGAAYGKSNSNLLKEEWEAFKLEHSKTYLNKVEEGFRMKIYLENRLRIAKHNKNPEKRFKLGMNKYGDLLQQEFNSMMNGYRMDLKRNDTGEGKILFLAPENYKDLPQSLDWRDEGFVTPIKDQGQCGSCWSFSATGALEGQQKRKTGVLVSLSEQNLVDCSTVDGNNGCEGGIMDYAYRYIKENNGIDTEESYPYEAKDDQCRFTPSGVGADDEGFVDIPEGNEDALFQAVATVGPISVAIDATHESFQLYESGIYFEESCSSTELDHAVLVIGYGSENGEDYWLVKNSWGEGWGDGGYIKMARNMNNNCGIATMASYPIV